MQGGICMKKMISAALCIVLTLAMAVPAFAAEQPTEIESAGAYLRERGIYQGDSSGDLMLDKGLTRAEMAAVLTRLHGEGTVNLEYYTWACYFTDVPEWAKPYVGYCVANLLVAGYDESHYGPNDPVTPAMACTVVLRCCGYKSGEGNEWSYNTAGDYAVSLGLLSQSTVRAATITRGEMAVLICRTLRQQEEDSLPSAPVEDVPSSSAYQFAADGSFTISQDSWSREDFSRQANSAVFTGFYTREVYNAMRQTLVDIEKQSSPDYQYAYTMVAKGDACSAVWNLLGRMNGVLRYEHHVPENFANYWQYLDYFAMSAAMPDSYQDAYEFVQPIISTVSNLSDSQKVEELNDYLCTLLTYDRTATAAIRHTFASHSEELKAACGSYAEAFQFLCSAAGIPCIIITTDNHAWNLVYVNGEWLHVDVAANDVYRRHYILLSKTYPDHPDSEPEATAFLKELLAPGSTK